MDLNSLRDQVSNLSLYDLKAGVRKVQNAVMNYTEMEAKVREATNNEPWGASSSLMQEIATGTHNYQLLNEIMPMIYKRFTEKSAEEWRQIYKALQLMEFLVKNGSERVIDDARSHLSLLKMLRQFHYIDLNGKDQGINVRNRSKELTDLLSDVEKIRSERKKARSTRNKYGGVEGGMGMGGSMSSSGRYGGFGSEDQGAGQGGYGGFSGGVYGDGGGFGGQTADDYDTRDSSRGRDRFDEYDEYDEGAVAPPGRRKADTTQTSVASAARRNKKQPELPKVKEPEVDLFSFGDDDLPPIPAVSTSNGKQAVTADFGNLQSGGGGDDDDFDDFQSATPSTQAPTAAKPTMSLGSIPPPLTTTTTSSITPMAAPQPRSAAQAANYTNLFSTTSPAPSGGTLTPSNTSAFASPPIQPQSAKPIGYQAAAPNYFTSVQAGTSQPQQAGVKSPGATTPSAGSTAAKPKKGGDAFAALLGGNAVKSKTPTGSGLTIADMAKQKASAGIWGNTGTTSAPATSNSSQVNQKTSGGGGAMDDLLG